MFRFIKIRYKEGGKTFSGPNFTHVCVVITLKFHYGICTEALLQCTTFFHLCHSSKCTHPYFLGVLHALFLPSHWLLSHITIIKTIISSYRELNPVA